MKPVAIRRATPPAGAHRALRHLEHSVAREAQTVCWASAPSVDKKIVPFFEGETRNLPGIRCKRSVEMGKFSVGLAANFTIFTPDSNNLTSEYSPQMIKFEPPYLSQNVQTPFSCGRNKRSPGCDYSGHFFASCSEKLGSLDARSDTIRYEMRASRQK